MINYFCGIRNKQYEYFVKIIDAIDVPGKFVN